MHIAKWTKGANSQDLVLSRPRADILPVRPLRLVNTIYVSAVHKVFDIAK